MSKIADLKRAVPIEEVLEHYGAEINPTSTRDWIELRCPFHADETASAAYSPVLDKFKCLGCDFSGDIFDIVMQEEGLQLKEAMAFVKEHFND